MKWRHIICVDLEATCCEKNEFSRQQMEIIEIGAVAVDTKFEVVGEYQTFVQPMIHPTLTDFCKQLTTITQMQVDDAPPFYLVWTEFKRWMSQYQPCIWTSWGGYDANQFQLDLSRIGHGKDDFLKRHFNAKAEFSKQQGLRSRVGLKAAVTQFAGFEWQGTHHRGIDDARNLASLMPFVKGDEKISDIDTDIMEAATAMLGDQKKARAWLVKKRDIFQGMSAVEYSKNVSKVEVLKVVGRIRHGVST